MSSKHHGLMVTYELLERYLWLRVGVIVWVDDEIFAVKIAKEKDPNLCSTCKLNILCEERWTDGQLEERSHSESLIVQSLDFRILPPSSVAEITRIHNNTSHICTYIYISVIYNLLLERDPTT